MRRMFMMLLFFGIILSTLVHAEGNYTKGSVVCPTVTTCAEGMMRGERYVDENGCPAFRCVETTATVVQAGFVCPQLAPPADSFRENCTARNGTIANETANGCVIGYECKTPLQDDGVESCPSISPPSATAEQKCAALNGTLIARKKGECTIGYICSVDDTAPRPRPIASCVNQAMASELTDLLKELKDAVAANKSVDDIKARIQALQERIKGARQDCMTGAYGTNLGRLVSGAVKEKNGSASGIVSYYKQRIAEISAENDSERIEALKSLRAEIDDMIRDYVNNESDINLTSIGPLVKRFTLTGAGLDADGVKMAAQKKRFMIDTVKSRIAIAAESHGLVLDEDGVKVSVPSVTVDNDTIKIGDKELKVLPKEALGKLKRATPKNLTIVQDGNQTYYLLKSEQKRKLFGLITAAAQHEARIDVENGTVSDEKAPWWQFLSTNAEPAQASTQ